MLSFSFSSMHYLFGTSNDYESKSKYKVFNTFYDYPQLIKQVECAIGIAEGIKDKYLLNCILPETLQVNLFDQPPFIECYVFIEVMKTYLRYLDEEKESIMKSEDLLSLLLQTSIKVEDNVIYVYSRDTDLIETIRLISKEAIHNYEVQ